MKCFKKNRHYYVKFASSTQIYVYVDRTVAFLPFSCVRLLLECIIQFYYFIITSILFLAIVILFLEAENMIAFFGVDAAFCRLSFPPITDVNNYSMISVVLFLVIF